MPASVAALLDVFDVLNLSIDALGLPLSCLQLGSFFNQLLFLVMSPCVLGLLVLACSMATEIYAKRKAASLKAGLISALPYLLYLLFFAFPLVSSRAFQAFECEEFDDGTRFLRVDYSLDCNDDEHGRVVALAWVAIALYPIGIPLLYLALLLSARKAILTEQPTDLSRSLTFLHQDYEPSMFCWEIIEIFKKARCLLYAAPRSHPLRVSYPHASQPTCLRSAAVPRRLLRAHPPRFYGATHHWLCLLTRSPPLHVDRWAVPTPRPR